MFIATITIMKVIFFYDNAKNISNFKTKHQIHHTILIHCIPMKNLELFSKKKKVSQLC